jgi:hypothetical protein
MHPARLATLLAIALVALALSILLGRNAGATVTRLPQECSYELVRRACCSTACVVYERRPNPANADASLGICWASLSCPGAAPTAVEFCGCQYKLNPELP